MGTYITILAGIFDVYLDELVVPQQFSCSPLEAGLAVLSLHSGNPMSKQQKSVRISQLQLHSQWNLADIKSSQ